MADLLRERLAARRAAIAPDEDHEWSAEAPEPHVADVRSALEDGLTEKDTTAEMSGIDEAALGENLKAAVAAHATGVVPPPPPLPRATTTPAPPPPNTIAAETQGATSAAPPPPPHATTTPAPPPPNTIAPDTQSATSAAPPSPPHATTTPAPPPQTPQLPIVSNEENKAFGEREQRITGMMKQLNGMMDSKSLVQPDAQMKKDAVGIITANSYMLRVPLELEAIAKREVPPDEKAKGAARVMAPMAEIDKRLDAMQAQIAEFDIKQKGGQVPPSLPGLTKDQQAEFVDRSDRMRGMMNQADRMFDSKNAKQPDQAFTQKAMELINANRYMYNLPGDLKNIAAKNIGAGEKQALVDKALAPMAEIDKRMDTMAKAINDHYVGPEKPTPQLPGLTPSESKAFAFHNARLGEQLEHLDKLNDPKSHVPFSAQMKKDTLELLRANAYMQQVPKDLKAINDGPGTDGEKQAKVANLMKPVGEVVQKMDAMDNRVVAHQAENDAAAKRGVLGRAFDKVKDFANRAADKIVEVANKAIDKVSAGISKAASATVQMGADLQHMAAKGPGFMTSGVVENVEHKDGQAVVHYRTGSHEQVMSVDEKSPEGAAVAKALDHLKPGDKFEVGLKRDDKSNEIANVIDKSDGFQVAVNDKGAPAQEAKPAQSPGRTR